MPKVIFKCETGVGFLMVHVLKHTPSMAKAVGWEQRLEIVIAQSESDLGNDDGEGVGHHLSKEDAYMLANAITRAADRMPHVVGDE